VGGILSTVKQVNWNPRRPTGLLFLGRFSPLRARVDNFGDLLGPLLVNRIVDELGLEPPRTDSRLVSVGSILHLTKPGDVVWGTGANAKVPSPLATTALDVRAVRGPKTRDLLMSHGLGVPEVYGDPAILWSRFWPRESYASDEGGTRFDVSVVPNFHDFASTQTHHNVISPIGNPHEIISRISRSEFVVASSLHGIVLAEAFGIPARLMVPGVEPLFKYEDYYLGTGRSGFQPARSIDEAIALGGEPPHSCDTTKLLAAFPSDLWSHSSDD
jgi:pyruvyltransferase